VTSCSAPPTLGPPQYQGQYFCAGIFPGYAWCVPSRAIRGGCGARRRPQRPRKENPDGVKPWKTRGRLFKAGHRVVRQPRMLSRENESHLEIRKGVPVARRPFHPSSAGRLCYLRLQQFVTANLMEPATSRDPTEHRTRPPHPQPLADSPTRLPDGPAGGRLRFPLLSARTDRPLRGARHIRACVRFAGPSCGAFQSAAEPPASRPAARAAPR
jgi:hypothetical protein